GDKDTFRLALKLSGIDYRWADVEVAWAGWRQNNAWRRWTSVGFVQHCPAGAPLFLHRAAGEWNPLRPPGRVGLLSPRSPPYPRGHPRHEPERVAPAPAEVLEADAWAFEQLPA